VVRTKLSDWPGQVGEIERDWIAAQGADSGEVREADICGEISRSSLPVGLKSEVWELYVLFRSRTAKSELGKL
jgi:hypothetical protein